MTESETIRDGGRRRTNTFARRLLAEWRRLELPLAAPGRVVLAVSGGTDSTALLLACEELSRAGRLAVDIPVAHLDHGLRGESGGRDALWVEEVARGIGFECVVGRARVGERAAATGDNLEQAARRARYEFLAETARSRGACAVVTAHTLDDQAETVLLRLLRGSGADGLGGMSAVRRLGEEDESLLLARPLLRWARRADTEKYCRARGVEPRSDEMNADERFARVRVRRQLLPLAETFNPRAVEALARTAELLREDASALEALAARLLDAATVREEWREGRPSSHSDEEGGGKTVAAASRVNGVRADACDEGFKGRSERTREGEAAPPLRVAVLAGAPIALRRRALRLWVGRGRGRLRRVELAHVAGVERLLTGERGGRVAELPGGSRIERRRGLLFFRRAEGKFERGED